MQNHSLIFGSEIYKSSQKYHQWIHYKYQLFQVGHDWDLLYSYCSLTLLYIFGALFWNNNYILEHKEHQHWHEAVVAQLSDRWRQSLVRSSVSARFLQGCWFDYLECSVTIVWFQESGGWCQLPIGVFKCSLFANLYYKYCVQV